MTDDFDCHPLTPDRFGALEALFATDGVTRDCWCMYWRVRAKDWKAGSGSARHRAFRDRIEVGPPPGVLAYRSGEAVGWVQVTPRSDVPRFNGARSAKPNAQDTDLDQTWAISCFFLRKDVRRQGLMTDLARAACAFAAERGAQAVEAAPIAPRRPLIWGEGYVGITSALQRAGFSTIEQRTELRTLMRWTP
ncbi:MAG: GNAT family N-acetyltransferase [Pseudomonadota bacterium]